MFFQGRAGAGLRKERGGDPVLRWQGHREALRTLVPGGQIRPTAGGCHWVSQYANVQGILEDHVPFVLWGHDVFVFKGRVGK